MEYVIKAINMHNPMAQPVNENLMLDLGNHLLCCPGGISLFNDSF
jgi:hypothetical protein